MSDDTWENFAKDEPYWAVITDPRFKASDNGQLAPEDRALFFRSGRTFVEGTLDILQRHFGRRFTREDCCLDFGSGVGRLLLPMSKHCGRAIGLDISPTMRRLCMENALEFGAGNIECYSGIEHPALSEAQFDWVNSYIVFQHIDTVTGFQILDALLRRVKPNGAISLHFTVYKDRRIGTYVNDRYSYFTVDQNGVREVVTAGTYYEGQVMMMNDYDVTRLFMMFGEHGFNRLLTHHEDQEGMHGLIFYGIKDQAD